MTNDQRVAAIKDYQAQQAAYANTIYRLRQKQLRRPILTQADSDRYDSIQLKIDQLSAKFDICEVHINSLIRCL